MALRSLKIACSTIVLLLLSPVLAAYAGGSEDGGNAQSPVQVIVQIVVTAIVLKILSWFDLP